MAANTPPPRSLADADNTPYKDPSGPNNILKYIGLVVALLVLLTAGWLVYNHLNDDDVLNLGDASSSPLADPPVVKSNGNPVELGKPVIVVEEDEDPMKDNEVEGGGEFKTSRIDFFIDGWSLRTLGDTKLEWFSDADNLPNDLTLAPVTNADIAALLKDTPQIVETALARQVTNDSRIKCNTDGCTVAGKEVDLSVLRDASKVEHFGDMYKDWNIDALLYRGSATASKGTGLVTLTAGDNYQAYAVTALPTGTKNMKPDTTNGYFRNRYFVSAALGTLFPPTATWADGKKNPTVAAPAPISGIDPAVVPSLVQEPVDVAAVTGLKDPLEAQSDILSASFLTYMSSPTTGCGIGVLCVPDTLPVEVVSRTKEAAQVCAEGLEEKNVAILDNVHIKVTLPHPIHQFGVWGGKTADELPGADGYGALAGGTPPLVKGPLELRWLTVGFYDGNGGELRNIFGGINTKDSGHVEDATSLDMVLENTNADGYTWSTC